MTNYQLTVKQLINKLKKMPPDAVVIWKDQDHGEGELGGIAAHVYDATDEFVESDRFAGRSVVAMEP